MISSAKSIRGRGSRGQGRSSPHYGTSYFSPLLSQKMNITTKPQKPLTHFIALPLGHHALLRERVSSFTGALQLNDPPIPGLDKSVIIAPRRLHLTLGVMSLDSDPLQTNNLADADFVASSITSRARPKTLSSALSLLTDLKPRILEIIGDQKLRVALNRMDIMKPEQGDLDRAHILWLGPLLESEDGKRLKDVCALVNQEFIDAGLVVDERRPLKLHCTVINTIHRKPRSGRRQPFSYSSVLTSAALQAIKTADSSAENKPVPVDLGVWDVNEIQICKMGSFGPQGEYVSCGDCSLVNP